MKFEKSRCYSAVNAELLAVGDLVYVADSIATLQTVVSNSFARAMPIEAILPATNPKRFKLIGIENPFALAYLVCQGVNAKAYTTWKNGQDIECLDVDTGTWIDADPKSIDFAKGLYRPRVVGFRPFKSTNELISCFSKKIATNAPAYAMPLVWLREKRNNSKQLITGFYDYGVEACTTLYTLPELFDAFTFLDGTPCGALED